MFVRKLRSGGELAMSSDSTTRKPLRESAKKAAASSSGVPESHTVAAFSPLQAYREAKHPIGDNDARSVPNAFPHPRLAKAPTFCIGVCALCVRVTVSVCVYLRASV
jgi:hypothetical protein